MTVQYKGQGDPQRSLELLWRARRDPTRGPKPGISIDQIVEAAITVADADGLVAVTMRRVAEQLNVGTMSLYTYIPGKAELLDVMLDEVYGEVSAQSLTEAGWRDRLEWHARQLWELFQRHPWVLQVSDVRSLLGPNELKLLESALSTVAGLDLTGREMMSVVSLVDGWVRGAAQVTNDARRVANDTGISDDLWWTARSEVFDQYFDAADYPTMASLDLEGAFDPVDDPAEYHVQLAIESFVFGLQRVLDGIAIYIERRNGGEGAVAPSTPL